MTGSRNKSNAPNPTAFCHKLVRDVAQAIAGELYEIVMGDNDVRAEWKKQNPNLNECALVARFVAKNWGNMIPQARATMALILRDPSQSALHADIYEALCLDATLRHGRPQNLAPAVDILNREKFGHG
jgi:hypothetical protein